MKKIMLLTSILIYFLSIESLGGNYDKYIIDRNGNAYTITTQNGLHGIYSYQPEKGVYKQFDINYINDNCFLGEPSLSPDGLNIAFKGGCDFPGDGDMEKAPNAHYRLTIINIKTRMTIASINHAGIFSFSPHGEAIVYAEDIPGEPGMNWPSGYKGGLWIYNIANRETQEIDTAHLGVMDLNWSPHDGNIYLTNNDKIFRYDPVLKKGAIVDIPGIYFSNDGKFNLSVKMSGTKVYSAVDGKPVKYLNDSLSTLGNIAMYRSWALNGTAMLVTTGNEQYYIINLNDGHVAGEFKGQLVGQNYEGNNFLIHPLKSNDKGPMRIDKESFKMIQVP